MKWSRERSTLESGLLFLYHTGLVNYVVTAFSTAIIKYGAKQLTYEETYHYTVVKSSLSVIWFTRVCPRYQQMSSNVHPSFHLASHLMHLHNVHDKNQSSVTAVVVCKSYIVRQQYNVCFTSHMLALKHSCRDTQRLCSQDCCFHIVMDVVLIAHSSLIKKCKHASNQIIVHQIQMQVEAKKHCSCLQQELTTITAYIKHILQLARISLNKQGISLYDLLHIILRVECA